MFFSSGVRCMIVMGFQETELSTNSAILSEQERKQLESYIEVSNQEYYTSMVGNGEEDAEQDIRPYNRIGQSLLDLAARQKQDIYQAVSLAREHLMISCSSAKPSGGI
jgi:hypothetical protein